MSMSYSEDWRRRLGLRRREADSAASRATTGGGSQSSEPVEVYLAANDLEAQVIKGFLEANGIPVMLRREALGTTLGVAVGHLAEVSVMVPEPLADRAVELLEEQAELADQLPDLLDEDEDPQDR
jgi:hypothetical protein